MTVTYGTLPFYTFLDRDKIPLANGRLYFFDNSTRQPKPVFSDVAGTIPYSNPLSLDSAGRVPQIYFENDAAYYIEWRDSNNALVNTLVDYTPPNGGDSPIVETSLDFDNLLINGQFRFFEQEEYTTVPTTQTKVAEPSFFFQKNGAGTSDTLKFVDFPLDADNPDATPIKYLEYDNPTPGVGETFADLIYEIQDVRSLQNERVTISVAAADLSGNSSTLEILYEQFFGTGGTPSATNQVSVISFVLDTEWPSQDLFHSFTVDDLIGKQIGTNGDDKFVIRFRLSPGSAGRVSLTNIYLKRGEPSLKYPYETYSQTDSKLRALDLPLATINNNGDYLRTTASQYNLTPSLSYMPAPFIGSIVMAVQDTADQGWLICNGQAQPKLGLYERLFAKLDYDQTALSGFSSRTDATDKILFVSDNVGTPANAPITNAPFMAAIINPGSATERFEIEVTFPTGADLVTVQDGETFTPKWFRISSPGQNFGVVYRVDQEYFDFPDESATSFSIVDVSSDFTAEQVRDETLEVVKLLNPSGMASEDNFISGLASDTVTIDSLTVGSPVATPNAETSGFTVTIINGGSSEDYQKFTVKTIAASSMAAGSFFSCGTPKYTFAFYFIIDGLGLEPTNSYDYKVPIFLDSTSDGVNEVAAKVKDAVDRVLFQVPDMRGLFVRGAAQGAPGFDPYHNNPNIPSAFASKLNAPGGQYQYDELRRHTHTFRSNDRDTTGREPVKLYNLEIDENFNGVIAPTGGRETRPKNIYVIYYIKGY